MKKILMTIAAFSAAVTMAVAGPGVVEAYQPVVDYSSAYVGAGFGFGTAEASAGAYDFEISESQTVNNITLQGGYNFNQYVAVEGRYNIGLDEDVVYADGYTDTISVDTLAVFVKPQYPVTAELSVYGLLGYAWNDLNSLDGDVSVDGFAYGVGAKYEVAENIEIFVDYTSVYDDTETFDTVYGLVDVEEYIYNITAGVSYKF
jgi:opacity protein-like surface antigen